MTHCSISTPDFGSVAVWGEGLAWPWRVNVAQAGRDGQPAYHDNGQPKTGPKSSSYSVSKYDPAQ
jgi:hypothetical protein